MAGQVWLRDQATAPWFLDCIRYKRPEVVLHHKARLLRAKDTADLVTTWPLLAPEAQAWLRGAVHKERADNPWLDDPMGE